MSAGWSADNIAGYCVDKDQEWLAGTPRPVVPPLYQSTVYFIPSSLEGEMMIAGKKPGYFYNRWGNPTVDACAHSIAQLERAEGGTILVSSGMAAVSLVLLTFLRSGDHLICQYPVYADVINLIEQFLMENHVEVSWMDTSEGVEGYEKAIKPNTKVIFIESPCNPKMTVQDFEAFGKLCGRHPSVITVVDGTFASAYLQQPLSYGLHVSIHSCTKYMGGHSDVTAGCVSFATKELMERANRFSKMFGAILSPSCASLLHRSLKTLPIRMERHSTNTMAIAEFLERHEKITLVHYPGLESHPQHVVAKRQMKYFSGMITFEVVGGKTAGMKLVESVRLISLAVSLGGTGSLIEHPASMTNGGILMNEAGRQKAGITDGLVRFSVGLEHVDDLIADLSQALDKI